MGDVPDILSGIAYFAGSLAALAVEVFLIRHRRGIGRSLVDRWQSSNREARRGTRWLSGPWGDPRLDDLTRREELEPWVTAPLLAFMPLLAIVLFFAGVAALRR